MIGNLKMARHSQDHQHHMMRSTSYLLVVLRKLGIKVPWGLNSEGPITAFTNRVIIDDFIRRRDAAKKSIGARS